MPGWTEEVFLVKQIYTTKPVVTYKLTEWDGTPIKGTFYQEDVQKVIVPDDTLFRIDQVLKRKGKQVFVSWKGWPNKKTVGCGNKICKRYEGFSFDLDK